MLFSLRTDEEPLKISWQNCRFEKYNLLHMAYGLENQPNARRNDLHETLAKHFQHDEAFSHYVLSLIK